MATSHHPSHPSSPRYHKLEFPTYDDTDDLLSWLNRCEQFFRGHRTEEDDKVWLASYHLTNVAQQWYFQLERDEGQPMWGQFKDFCHMRFGPPIRSNPLGELTRLQRTGSVGDYQNKFLALLCRANRLSTMQQVQIFMAGLFEPLRTDVELQQPNNLQVAMSLARAYKRRAQTTVSVSNPQTRPWRPPQRPSTPLPAVPRSQELVPQAHAAPVSRPTKPFRRLTPTELAEHRSQGLCYNCDDKFQPGHRCKQPFITCIDMGSEVEDGDDEWGLHALEAEEPAPEVSLHAVTGTSTSDTMQLTVIIGTTDLIALVDSGSTHNLLSARAVQAAALQLLPRHFLRVKIANGEQVDCAGLCHHLPIKVSQDQFEITMYAIPLDGFYIVLGVQWLKTLGPILWDFDDLTMTFWLAGRRIQWQGLSPAHSMQALVHTGHELLWPLLDEFQGLFDDPSGLPPVCQ